MLDHMDQDQSLEGILLKIFHCVDHHVTFSSFQTRLAWETEVERMLSTVHPADFFHKIYDKTIV